MSTDYDEQSGAQAFESLKPTLDAIPLSELKFLNVDLRDTAILVFKAVAFLSAYRDRFLGLPSYAFDIKDFDGLTSLAQAAWFIKTERIQAQEATSAARLPEVLVKNAKEKRHVMLRVAAYHLQDPVSVAEIERIQAGSGYVDLASDLQRLAKLYEAHHETISQDARFYRAEDTDEARTLAKAIIKELSTDRSERTWLDYQQRIWTLLSKSYQETKHTAEWLLRDEKISADLLPTLSRGGRRRSS